jgi:two-component system response regulator RegA
MMAAGMGKREVLVVDDDPRILAMYRRSFDDEWTIHCAESIEAGLQIGLKRPLDAAVLDLHVGPKSSIQLIQQLRAALPQLRIMVVSGYLTTEVTVTAVQSGADVVVDKPIRPREVMNRLMTDAKPEAPAADTPTLEEAIDSHIARVYADCDGNISETARRLGIYRSSLQRRLRRKTIKRVR